MEYGFLSDEAEKFPPMVIVDMTNVCNLRCIHCAHRIVKKEPGYKPEFMKFEMFKKIVDEVKDHKITLMRLASDGESLLHKDLLKCISYAKENGITPVNLTTNAMLMNEEISEKFVEIGLDIVDISIDATTSETYEKIRVGGDFSTVIANTEKLIEIKNRRHSSMKIFVSFVNQKENCEEAQAFEQFWEGKVDQVLIRNFCNVLGMVKDVDGVVVQENLPDRWPCPQFWKRVTITHAGDLRFCVEDWRNKTVLGNIMDSSIEKIWTGEKYQKLRKIHLSNNYDSLPFCQECTDWATSAWDYGYEKLIGK
ncbi:MAG: radical SAM/SPASM domain-containing protein [Pseudomonadota bacterium]